MLCDTAADFPPFHFSTTMSFPQLGYQYIRPIYPPERQGIASNARSGTELSPSGALSNVLSSMYGSPFAAAAQGYGAFLPYTNDISLFNQLVSLPLLSLKFPATFFFLFFFFFAQERAPQACRRTLSTHFQPELSECRLELCN